MKTETDYQQMTPCERTKNIKIFSDFVEKMNTENQWLVESYFRQRDQLAQYRKNQINLSLYNEDEGFIREFLDNRGDEIEDFVSNLVKEYKEVQ